MMVLEVDCGRTTALVRARGLWLRCNTRQGVLQPPAADVRMQGGSGMVECWHAALLICDG